MLRRRLRLEDEYSPIVRKKWVETGILVVSKERHAERMLLSQLLQRRSQQFTPCLAPSTGSHSGQEACCVNPCACRRSFFGESWSA